jgi:FAD/FMN-containing dehydrogenase
MKTIANDRYPSVPLPGISPVHLGRLAARLDGPLLLAGDVGYDAARRVFNAMIDRRPALVVRCASAQDVVEGVTFARTHDLALAVKGGGHGVAGNAVCDGGLLLDLSAMKAVRVDASCRVATVQPGSTLGELDLATEPFGLATPTGVVSVTGLSGLALGGGVGWLNGKHGLTCDNLLAAEVVTANGERITTNAKQHSDLFWGIRGGGGNFGVVISLTLKLHPLEHVLAGAVTYAARKARAALRLYHEFASACPDPLTANASLFQTPDGEVAVAIAICYAGLIEHGDRLLDPLRRLGPEADAIEPMSYRALQRANDAGFPSGQQHYWKAGYLTALDDELIETMLDFVSRMPSPASGVGLQQLHGAAGRADAAATAFPHRGDRYDCLILSQWPDPADSPKNISWTRAMHTAITPFLADGVYVNNLGDDSEKGSNDAYGLNYERLAALKAEYDPTNLFRHNQNIEPSRSAL